MDGGGLAGAHQRGVSPGYPQNKSREIHGASSDTDIPRITGCIFLEEFTTERNVEEFAIKRTRMTLADIEIFCSPENWRRFILAQKQRECACSDKDGVH